MILNKMTPDVVYKRTLIIDVMYQMPIAMIEQAVEIDKLPGDYIESFFEEDGTETKRLNFEWLLFKATNYQLEAIVKRIIPVKKAPEQIQEEITKVEQGLQEQEVIRSGYLHVEEDGSAIMSNTPVVIDGKTPAATSMKYMDEAGIPTSHLSVAKD